MNDLGMNSLEQQRSQDDELAAERLADELVELAFYELLSRVETAKSDSHRPPCDRIRLIEIYEELDELIVECSEYRI